MNIADNVLMELKTLLVERGILNTTEIAPQTGLDLLSIDSVEMALIFAHFEQKYDAEFENQEIVGGKYRTLEDIALSISKKIH